MCERGISAGDINALAAILRGKTFIDPDRSVRSRLVSGSNGTCTIPLCDCTCEPLRSGTRRSFDCLCTPHTQSSRSVAGLCQKKRGAGQDDRFFVDCFSSVNIKKLSGDEPLTAFVHYTVMTPKNFRISVARIMSSMTGAIQRTMTTNSFLRRKVPEVSTSSMTILGPTM